MDGIQRMFSRTCAKRKWIHHSLLQRSKHLVSSTANKTLLLGSTIPDTIPRRVPVAFSSPLRFVCNRSKWVDESPCLDAFEKRPGVRPAPELFIVFRIVNQEKRSLLAVDLTICRALQDDWFIHFFLATCASIHSMNSAIPIRAYSLSG